MVQYISSEHTCTNSLVVKNRMIFKICERAIWKFYIMNYLSSYFTNELADVEAQHGVEDTIGVEEDN